MPGSDEFKVMVRKLPPNPNEEDLKAFFGRAGEVIDCFTKEGRDGWFGFIGYNNANDLEEALKLTGREFEGCTLEVERKQVKKCFNCGKDGHMSARCPAKNGAPDASGGRVCFKCQRPGHISRDCPGPVAERDDRRRRDDTPPRRRRDSRDDRRRRDSRSRSPRRDSRSPRRDSRSPKRTRR